MSNAQKLLEEKLITYARAYIKAGAHAYCYFDKESTNEKPIVVLTKEPPITKRYIILVRDDGVFWETEGGKAYDFACCEMSDKKLGELRLYHHNGIMELHMRNDHGVDYVLCEMHMDDGRLFDSNLSSSRPNVEDDEKQLDKELTADGQTLEEVRAILSAPTQKSTRQGKLGLENSQDSRSDINELREKLVNNDWNDVLDHEFFAFMSESKTRDIAIKQAKFHLRDKRR
jgi:hypothetical protein